jgi:PAS domain-containing protein
MRTKLPVTRREFDFPAHPTRMSTPDPTSRIRYANDVFVAASGYSREEIQGEPHKLVRYPDRAGMRLRWIIDGVTGQVHVAKTAPREIAQGNCRRVDEAGRTMDDIVMQVRQVSTMIEEIDAATAEQTSGIAQVAQAIGHIEQVTQQNAPLVEQSGAASERLREQMGRLADAVGVFR